MKVEYKCTMERVNEIITRAAEDEQEIDHIELNWNEWWAFTSKIEGHGPDMTTTFHGTPFHYRATLITRKQT